MTTYRIWAWGLGVLVGMMILTSFSTAQGANYVFYDETQFLSYAGTVTMESFETIPNDSWIYDTRLPSPIPALDLTDDPNDPDDGPDYDLDGHFTITGNSISRTALEKFWIKDDAPTTDEVDGDQYLNFAPWYNILWPDTFDVNDQHPIITFDNFNNSDASINAFGLYFYNYNPGSKWRVMEFGSDFIPVNLTGSTGSYFFGVITDSFFDEVQLHTNQNGGSMNIDEIYYSSNASAIPIPGAVWLLGSGIIGIVGIRRKFKK